MSNRTYYQPSQPTPHDIETELIQVLGLKDFGRLVDQSLLAKCLWVAATLLSSLSSVAKGIAHVSIETLRKAWLNSLPKSRDELLKQALPRLWDRISPRLAKKLRHRGMHLAIDFHGRPCDGNRDCPHIVGGKEKKSTKWFWSYATACIVDRGFRWTIAVTYVEKKEGPDQVVRRLLKQIEPHGVPIRLALFDSGFYSARLIALLQARRISFIVPALKRGTKTTGTRPFFQLGTRGWFDYEWTGRATGDPTVRVAIASVPEVRKKKNKKSKNKKTKRKQLVYACSKRLGSLERVIESYQMRFGIETSYRQIAEGLPKTTSNDPVWRLALFLVGVLIRNLWVCWKTGRSQIRLKEMELMIACEFLPRLAVIIESTPDGQGSSSDSSRMAKNSRSFSSPQAA